MIPDPMDFLFWLLVSATRCKLVKTQPPYRFILHCIGRHSVSYLFACDGQHLGVTSVTLLPVSVGLVPLPYMQMLRRESQGLWEVLRAATYWGLKLLSTKPGLLDFKQHQSVQTGNLAPSLLNVMYIWVQWSFNSVTVSNKNVRGKYILVYTAMHRKLHTQKIVWKNKISKKWCAAGTWSLFAAQHRNQWK